MRKTTIITLTFCLFTFIAFTSLSKSDRQTTNQQFEYLQLSFSFGLNGGVKVYSSAEYPELNKVPKTKSMSEVLNHFGSKGWELVLQYKSTNDRLPYNEEVMLFKRLK